jgi:hypothetical protein
VFQEGQSPAAVFAGVMRFITDGKYTPEELGAACSACMITSPREIMQKPNLAPEFTQTLADLRTSATA